jgi:hypothetical protein
MTTPQNISELRKAAESYRVSPPTSAWVKLDSKLRNESPERKSVKLNTSLMAAMFFLSIAFVALVSYAVENSKSSSYSENSWYTSDKIESLSVSKDALYNTQNIYELKMAYNKLGLSTKG